MSPQKLNIRAKELVTLPIDQLIPHENNWRLQPEKQRYALTSAIRCIGWIAPIIVSARTHKVLDGHLRLDVAKAMGLKEVPCILVDATEAEEKAILASSDAIGELAIPDFLAIRDIIRQVEDSHLKDIITATLPIDISADQNLSLDDSAFSGMDVSKGGSVVLYFSKEEYQRITSAFRTEDFTAIILAIKHFEEEHTDAFKKAIAAKVKERRAKSKEERNAA